jgi:hypothetical protein
MEASIARGGAICFREETYFSASSRMEMTVITLSRAINMDNLPGCAAKHICCGNGLKSKGQARATPTREPFTTRKHIIADGALLRLPSSLFVVLVCQEESLGSICSGGPHNFIYFLRLWLSTDHTKPGTPIYSDLE